MRHNNLTPSPASARSLSFALMRPPLVGEGGDEGLPLNLVSVSRPTQQNPTKPNTFSRIRACTTKMCWLHPKEAITPRRPDTYRTKPNISRHILRIERYSLKNRHISYAIRNLQHWRSAPTWAAAAQIMGAASPSIHRAISMSSAISSQAISWAIIRPRPAPRM